MYHALLTNRYLTSRVIPLIAVAAVALGEAAPVTELPEQAVEASR